MSVLPQVRRWLASRAGSRNGAQTSVPSSRSFQSANDLKVEVASRVADLAKSLGAIRCSVLLREDNLSKSIVFYCISESELVTNCYAQVDEIIAERAAESNSVNEIRDIDRDQVLSDARRSLSSVHPEAFSFRSISSTPIVIDSDATGSLIVYRDKKGGLAANEKQLVESAANELGLIIQQMRFRDATRRLERREELTSQILRAVAAAGSLESSLEAAVHGLGSALQATRAVVYLNSGHVHDLSRAGLLKLTARAEYLSNALIPSLRSSILDIEGSPILPQLASGEPVFIDDINESHPVVRAIGVRLGVRAIAMAPLNCDGRLRGLLTIEQFELSRRFEEEELALIRMVTDQMSVAIKHSDLAAQAHEAMLRERSISKISSAIHSSLDPNAVLQAIVDELGSALSVCRCRLALLPTPLPSKIPITHEYASECCSSKDPGGRTLRVANNQLIQAVLASNHPVAVNDALTDPRVDKSLVTRDGVRAVIGSAIRLDGKPIGVISVRQHEGPYEWKKWEIDLVASVAEQAAVAIRQAELYTEAREAATRAALANEIVTTIRRSLDLKETLRLAVAELGSALRADRSYFHQMTTGGPALLALHASKADISGPDEHHAAFIHSYLAEKRRTLIIDDFSSFVQINPESQSGESEHKSLLALPIFAGGQFWGSLSISEVSRARKWSSSDIALAELVAAQIEVAVSHSQLYEESRRTAQRESLITRIVHKINQSNSLHQILPIVARELGQQLGTESIFIARQLPADGRWTIDCSFTGGILRRPGSREDAEEFSQLVGTTSADTVRSVDVQTDPNFAHLETRIRAFLSVNVKSADGRSFAITAVMNSGPRSWTLEESSVIRAAADQMLIAIERAELFEQVSRGKHEWESTFDSLYDGVLIFDQDGLLRRVNAAGAALEGSETRGLIGRKCCTLMQGIEGDSCKVAEVIRSGRPVTFELQPRNLARPVLITISPLTNGVGLDARHSIGTQDVRGAVCIIRDLSELRAAEAVAREQHGFLIKLIEHANDAIFALNPLGKFIWFNEQLMSLSGYSREELFAADFRQFVLPHDRRTVVDRFTKALEGQAQTFELRGIQKSGDTRLLLITYTPIYDEGRVTSVLSISRDITEERLASERAAQADKLRALGQLASGVAHNFNNILAAILGHAQLMKRDCSDTRMTQRIDIIERAALDGAQTVKRIQGFGLKYEGSIHESVDVNQILVDSTQLTRARWREDAQARGINYEVESDLQPVPTALGSPSELREVFVNILLNALDAMPQGGRLRIRTESKDANIYVHFIDDGIGMSREVRDHVFEPFFTTKGASGMGLGLAVSYSIMERHGGRIEVTSSLGQGSTFTVLLPPSP